MLGNPSFLRIRGAVLVLGLLCSMLMTPAAFAATEDIIYMSDGRELHGEIVRETDSIIVFEYMNPDLGISVPLTLPKSSILKIDRDVTVAEPAGSTPATAEPDADSGSDADSTPATRSPGEVASLYIIPMNGEIGTDIRSGIYEDVIDEIKSTRPDVVILELNSKNSEDNMLSYWLGRSADKDKWWEADPFRRRELITQLMDDEQETVLKFHHNIPKDIRQVVWVRDATGPAALLALSWEDMYMHSDASIGSLGEIWSMIQFKDDDVRSKMEKAWFGAAKGMMQFGGHSDELLQGLLRPNSPLSFSCKGRQPVWYNSFEGDIPITPDWGFGAEISQSSSQDGRIQFGYEMTARPCEDMLISDGTADTLDDLALLLNLREYEVVESANIEEVVEYRDNWREQLVSAEDAMKDYTKYMRLGSLADLQKAKKALSRLTARVRNDESVATRIQSLYGVDLVQLEILMEQLKSQIRQQARGGGRGGGGGGGAGGRGGGGGGG
jgi:hypothetical protein